MSLDDLTNSIADEIKEEAPSTEKIVSIGKNKFAAPKFAEEQNQLMNNAAIVMEEELIDREKENEKKKKQKEKEKEKKQNRMRITLFKLEQNLGRRQDNKQTRKINLKIYEEKPREKWLRGWHISRSGNPTKKVDEVWITILQSKHHSNKYAISIDRNINWRYLYSSISIAKEAAFDLFYSGNYLLEERIIGRNQIPAPDDDYDNDAYEDDWYNFVN